MTAADKWLDHTDCAAYQAFALLLVAGHCPCMRAAYLSWPYNMRRRYTLTAPPWGVQEVMEKFS